jgi:hypothetical protein
MGQKSSHPLVREIMLEFADLTGLSSSKKKPRRYLWTDAFAVCNFLELYRQTRDDRYRQLSLHLIDQVHNVLGRHRDDDPRTGWISGLDEHGGGLHPTQGGLRIGKGMKERGPGEPHDEQSEWDRDGQYYHYLIKWMHALNRAGTVTRDPTYTRWAIELAKTAHARFTYIPASGSRKRIYWKMSIDLSYPLVSSMGQYDPLDGFITYFQLQAAASKALGKSAEFDLGGEIADMAGICEGKRWETDDPLGLGELLSMSYKLAQLVFIEGLDLADLLLVLLDASLVSLQSLRSRDLMNLPAQYRLAFRELGLSIGLHAVTRLLELLREIPRDFSEKNRFQARTESLMEYMPLCNGIETYWLAPSNRQGSGWAAHRDINMVMLATSLAPDGYLSLH